MLQCAAPYCDWASRLERPLNQTSQPRVWFERRISPLGCSESAITQHSSHWPEDSSPLQRTLRTLILSGRPSEPQPFAGAVFKHSWNPMSPTLQRGFQVRSLGPTQLSGLKCAILGMGPAPLRGPSEHQQVFTQDSWHSDTLNPAALLPMQPLPPHCLNVRPLAAPGPYF